MLTSSARRWIALIFLLFAATGLTAAGCGGDDDNTSSTSSTGGIDSGTSTSSSSGDTGASSSGDSAAATDSGTSSSGDTGTPADTGTPDTGPQTFTVGGTVTGLAGSTGLALQLNGASTLPITLDGAFVFPNQLSPGAAYAVTISAQPTGKTCQISAGSGTIATGNVNTIVVNCAAGSFTVGGNVTGLAGGASVSVALNGGTPVAITATGAFALAPPLTTGTLYAVTITTQPTSPIQTCTVSNGSGTMGAANVTNVAINCVTASFTVSGSVTGLLVGNSVVLQNNGGDNITVSGNNAFTFATSIPSGGTYNVTVFGNPTSPAQTCTVTANATGNVTNANITGVTVNCSTATFTVGGTLTGMNAGGTIVLQNNGGNNLTVAADGAFTFTTPQNPGTNFNVTILTNPTGQACTVSGGTGLVGAGNVTSVNVNCSTTTFGISGTITGLNGSNTITIANGAASTNVTGGTSFSLPAVATGTAYTVTTTSPTAPVSQQCVVTNGSGVMGGAPVTNVSILCQTRTFTVSGIVNGLTPGNAVGVTLTGGPAGNTSNVTTDVFTFPQALLSGTAYNIPNGSIVSPNNNTPGGHQTCTVVAGGSGTIANENVQNLVINCVLVAHSVSVTFSTYEPGSTAVGIRNTSPAPSGVTTITPTTNGTFVITANVLSGQAFAVDVPTDPQWAGVGSGASQHCTITAGASGTITNADVTATMTCVTNRFIVGGLISGLNPNGGVNGATFHLESVGTFGGPGPGPNVTHNANSAFTFPAAPPPDQSVRSGEAFTISIVTQPNNPPQTCRFTSAGAAVNGLSFTGEVGNGDFTGIPINCDVNPVLGGIIQNLVSTDNFFGGTCPPNSACGIALSNTVSPAPCLGPAGACSEGPTFVEGFFGNTPYTFANNIAGGKTFTATIPSNPTFSPIPAPGTGATLRQANSQTCTFDANAGIVRSAGPTGANSQATGTMPVTDKSDLNITCVNNPYTTSFTVTNFATNGSTDPMIVSNGQGDQIPVSGDGTFTFPAHESGSIYAIAITHQSNNPNQTCTVTNGGPYWIPGTNVTGVTSIDCRRQRVRITGTIIGLDQSFAGGPKTLSLTAVGNMTQVVPCVGTCATNQAYNIARTFNAHASNASIGFDFGGLDADTISVGSSYTVSVTGGSYTSTNPTGQGTTGNFSQTCVVRNDATNANSGTVAEGVGTVGNVTHIVVDCGRTCRSRLIVAAGTANGTQSIDPDGQGGLPAFDASCVMGTGAGVGTNDLGLDPGPGGWTLISSGDGDLAPFDVSGPESCSETDGVLGAGTFPVSFNSCEWLETQRTRALARLSEQVHISDDEDVGLWLKSVANTAPILNLRQGRILNLGLQNVAIATNWTSGPQVPTNDSTIFTFATDLTSGVAPAASAWPNVYWARGNEGGPPSGALSGGFHFIGTRTAWRNDGSFIFPNGGVGDGTETSKHVLVR